jgi:hypothetical protein
MNHSAKKQQHEKARKKHKHELQTHAREVAKRERSKMPIWFLVAGVGVVVALLLAASFGR